MLSSRSRALVGAVLACAALTGCGGGGSSHSTSTGSSSTTGSTTGATTTARKAPPRRLIQRVRVVGAPSGAPTNTAVKPGGEAVIELRVPSAGIGKHVTMSISQAGNGFVVHSVVGKESATTPIKTAGGLQVALLRWRCGLAADTFCPVTPTKSAPTNVVLGLKGSAVPVVLLATFNHPGAEKLPHLEPLAPPAPGATVAATIKIGTAVSGQPLKLGSTASAGPGSSVVGVVRVAHGTPAGALLKIAIPKTSGKTITVGAGGTAAKPSSTATIDTSAPVRISAVAYTCGLPPYTVCPIATRQTNTGLLMTLRTPHLPVVFKLTLAAG